MNMKQIEKIFLVILLTLGGMVTAQAQRVRDVHGKYTYEQRADESLNQAKAIALYKAKVVAIENEFGSHVQQTNFTEVKNGELDFKSLSMSDVNGDWLAETKEPKYSYSMKDDGTRIITVEVWGTAREIVSDKIPLEVYVLKNIPPPSSDRYLGMEYRNDFIDYKKYMAREFMDGDSYYVSFKSPIDGYISIYFMDEEREYFRLLPYLDDKNRCCKVEANKEYIFFSEYRWNYKEDNYNVLEYTLELIPTKSKEENELHVIFSKNEFLNPHDDISEHIDERIAAKAPPEVKYKHMQEWLLTNRRRDKSMQVVKVPITIIPRESY